MVKNPPAVQETPVPFLGREDPLEKDRLPTPVFLGFPCGSAGKESTYSVGDLGFCPWVGKIPWRREKLPTLVVWPGEFQSIGSQRVDTNEELSLSSESGIKKLLESPANNNN